jgi:hypothetical protein
MLAGSREVLPRVRVPVFSNTTVSMPAADSSAVAFGGPRAGRRQTGSAVAKGGGCAVGDEPQRFRGWLRWPVKTERGSDRKRSVADLGRHGGAGALERAVGRGHGRVQELGGLGRREGEHVAQQQSGALGGREPLHRGDERRRDTVTPLDDGGRIAAGGRELI